MLYKITATMSSLLGRVAIAIILLNIYLVISIPIEWITITNAHGDGICMYKCEEDHQHSAMNSWF